MPPSLAPPAFVATGAGLQAAVEAAEATSAEPVTSWATA